MAAWEQLRRLRRGRIFAENAFLFDPRCFSLSAAMFPPAFPRRDTIIARAYRGLGRLAYQFTNHNPGLLRSPHYFSALYKVICVARRSMITYDFKQLAVYSLIRKLMIMKLSPVQRKPRLSGHFCSLSFVC